MSCTARTATGWMAGPLSPPPPAAEPNRYPRVDGSIAIPSSVFVTVTAFAPASCARRAIDTTSVVCAVSFAHTGRSATATIAAMACAVSSACCAKRCAPPSRFGQLRLTSMAMMSSGAPFSCAATFSNSSMVRPQMLTTTRAFARCSAPRSIASHDSTPGPCNPTLFNIPSRASCNRGAALPAQGSAASDFTTTAPSRASGKYASSSAACPLVPDAVITGFGNSTSPTFVLASNSPDVRGD